MRMRFSIGAVWFVSAALLSWSLDSTKPLDQYLHHLWTSSNGLPQNTVYDIVQTPDGYVWLATADGVVRFDGVHFGLFDKSEIPRLGSTHAISFLKSSGGTLWIAFYGPEGGLVRYAEGKFQAYTPANGLSNTFFTALAEDRQGNLWIGTEGGLFVGRNGVFRRYSADDRLSQKIVSLAIAPDGFVWAVTDRRLLMIAGEGKPALAFSKPIHQPKRIYFDHAGTLWVGTEHGGVYSMANGRLRRRSGNEFSNAPVSAIFEDSNHILWVGSLGGGVCRLRSRFECYKQHDGLSSNDVYSLYQDREGSLWIGTALAGLNRLSDSDFRTYSAGHEQADSVWTMHSGPNGRVWAGNDRGLEQLQNGTITEHNLGEAVTAIEDDAQGGLWVGTAHGVKRFTHGKVRRTYTTAQGLASNKVTALHEDRSGSLWIGSLSGSGGLTRLSKGVFTSFSEKNGLASRRIHTIIEDHRSAIWLGTSKGLTRFQDGAFTNYAVRLAPDRENSDVNCIYEDPAGDLWIGTDGSGLVRMRNGALTFFTKADGLFDDTIWSVLEDDQNHLWMTSNRGLFQVSKADLNDFARQKITSIPLISYGTDDGLVTSEFNGGLQSAAVETSDGKMFFASIKGIVEVDQRKVTRNSAPPPIVIESALLDHHPLLPGAKLSVGGGSLEFKYGALSFLAPEKIVYRYKLEGFDKDWVIAGNRTAAFYTNLPPGRYEFQVIASNSDGSWTAEASSFGLTLNPHYYQSWMFRASCGLLVVATPFAIISLRQRAQKRMERKLEELIRLRSIELIKAKEAAEATAAAKSHLLANISHEIRTPVNGLLGMVELIRDAGLTPQQLELSDAAVYSGNALLSVLNEILDFSTLEAGKVKTKKEQLELPKMIASLTHMFSALAQKKGLTLRFQISSEIPDRVLGDPTRLFQVLVHLINNAIKFTEAGAVVISAEPLRSSRSEMELRVCVEDTGIGIRPEHHEIIFEPFRQADDSLSRTFGGTGLGLSIVSGLVSVMGGRIWLESELGKGTRFFFTVLLGFDAAVTHEAQGYGAQGSNASSAPGPCDLPMDILVVEDNPINRKFAVGILQRHGHRVTAAENGSDALEKLKQSSFDLILMDIQMPVMNGVEATLEIRRLEENSSRHVPIVALTAHASSEDREHCLQAGMDEYLSKPINGKQLATTVIQVYRRFHSAALASC